MKASADHKQLTFLLSNHKSKSLSHCSGVSFFSCRSFKGEEKYTLEKNITWQRAAEKEWDGRARFWNTRSKSMWENGSRKRIIPFIKEHIEMEKKILDVGCGDGYGSYKLDEAGYEVIAVDISSEMIALAKENRKQQDISFVQADVITLPFADGHFDAVLSINVLEWTENPLVALKELQRVLTTNGKLCIGILGPTAGPRSNSYSRLYGDQVVCNTMMPWEFLRLSEENGWKHIASFGVYKEGVETKHYDTLPLELQQALSFMWIFMLQKEEKK